jgi:energy-coupling factor transporter transmembrane protein EcfT
MTVDGLLAILLNVAIPSLLALAGGILAIRAFREAKSPERWAWIGVFFGLALVAIVLAFVQQVRFTSQQKEMDAKEASAELRSTNDNKYMQGQLDSINKVLTTVVSKPGDSGLIKDLLKSLASQASDASRSGNMISISLTPPRYIRPEVGWYYTWKHDFDTLTPIVSCFDSSGEQKVLGVKVMDRNTVVLGLPGIPVKCTLRK